MNTSSQPTLDIKVSMKEQIKHAVTTGVVVGLISYNVGALFPEQAFQSPAIWSALSTLAVYYSMPHSSPINKSLFVGAGMAAVCMFVTRDCPPSGALRYGAAAALSSYVAETYIVPRLLQAESKYI